MDEEFVKDTLGINCLSSMIIWQLMWKDYKDWGGLKAGIICNLFRMSIGTETSAGAVCRITHTQNLLWQLGFLTAWWLCSKSEPPKSPKQKLYHLVWSCLKSHLLVLLSWSLTHTDSRERNMSHLSVDKESMSHCKKYHSDGRYC